MWFQEYINILNTNKVYFFPFTRIHCTFSCMFLRLVKNYIRHLFALQSRLLLALLFPLSVCLFVEPLAECNICICIEPFPDKITTGNVRTGTGQNSLMGSYQQWTDKAPRLTLEGKRKDEKYLTSNRASFFLGKNKTSVSLVNVLLLLLFFRWMAFHSDILSIHSSDREVGFDSFSQGWGLK